MKKLYLAGVILGLFLLCGCAQKPTEKHAVERLEAYAYAIDYDFKKPEEIYPFLCQDFRDQMSSDDFCKCFIKERSYPYITPLYIYDPIVTLSADGKSGSAVFTQAARIEGMTYSLSFVYENGDYYIDDWRQFLDGSYLDKFDDIPYSIDWYYDFDSND